ncbi:MAG TPA: hypothetical protein EYN91_12330 [Candidatus Melainabacteria bacterium]|nr:hypothetical protein [Candidatus Melainabacteria bacterium]HIN63693.1 hypothetical protein [Candidatus Obscuribacterales bacterium]
MTTAFLKRVLAGLALLTIVSPMAAYADHDNHRHHNKNWRANSNWKNNNWKNNNWKRNSNWQKKHYKNVQKAQRKQNDRFRKIANNNNREYWRTHWGNNWNDQREWYRHNMRNMQRARQAQLDAQMRAQYLAYRNNNYNGPYGWDMYSEPGFLDYLHMRSPGLLNSIRSIIGF